MGRQSFSLPVLADWLDSCCPCSPCWSRYYFIWLHWEPDTIWSKFSKLGEQILASNVESNADGRNKELGKIYVFVQVCYFKSSGKLFQFSWFTLSSSSIDVLTSPQICNNNNWSMIKLSWWLIYKDIIIHHIFPHKCQSLKSNYQSSYWSSLCLLSTKLFLTHLPQFK